MVVLFDDERPTRRRGGSRGAGAPPVKFRYGRTGDYNLRGTIILEKPLGPSIKQATMEWIDAKDVYDKVSSGS